MKRLFKIREWFHTRGLLYTLTPMDDAILEVVSTFRDRAT